MPGRFFGPYPNSVAARETLQLLQKLFRLRPCEDTFFANRSRPCLQHQIGRCSAPCVGLVTREAYAQDIADAVQVLQGRNTELIAELGRRMEDAAERLEYEAAARFRDQIAMLKQIQASQSVTRIARCRHRRRRDRRRGPGVLRVGRVRARRPQPRQHELLPAWRARR